MLKLGNDPKLIESMMHHPYIVFLLSCENNPTPIINKPSEEETIVYTDGDGFSQQEDCDVNALLINPDTLKIGEVFLVIR